MGSISQFTPFEIGIPARQGRVMGSDFSTAAYIRMPQAPGGLLSIQVENLA